MANPFQQKVVDYIEYSSAAMQKAAEAVEKQAAVTRQVEALVPAVVRTLIDNGCFGEDKAEKAAQLLQNHVEALKILAKVAAHVPTGAVASIGTAVAAPEARQLSADERLLAAMNIPSMR